MLETIFICLLSKFNSMLKFPSDSYMGLWSTEKLDIPENKLLTTVTKDDIKNAFNAMTTPIQTMVWDYGLYVLYNWTYSNICCNFYDYRRK